jgi:hypothetical protein
MREDAGQGMSLADFKQMVREQFFMLLLDERRAVEAIPAMLDKDPDLAARMAVNLRKVIEVVGARSGVAQQRLAEIERMLKATAGRQSARNGAHGERELEPAVRIPAHATRGAKHV